MRRIRNLVAAIQSLCDKRIHAGLAVILRPDIECEILLGDRGHVGRGNRVGILAIVTLFQRKDLSGLFAFLANRAIRVSEEIYYRLLAVGSAVTAGKRIVLIVPLIQVVIEVDSHSIGELHISISIIRNIFIYSRLSVIIEILLTVIGLIVFQMLNQLRNLRTLLCRLHRDVHC